MQTRRDFIANSALLAAASGKSKAPLAGNQGLDPLGRLHIPIGVVDTVDPLKTFVEAEGNFSPGFGSYGIYFWIFDSENANLTAPTAPGVSCDHGLNPPGCLIPWSRWEASGVEVTTSVCSVSQKMPSGEGIVVAARAHLKNLTGRKRKVLLYVALRPLGPAGWAVGRLESSPGQDALLVDGRLALLSGHQPARAGVSSNDDIGGVARRGALPPATSATSAEGNCSGALVFDVALAATGDRTFDFVCPVLPGRRAARHLWRFLDKDSIADQAELNPSEGGLLQPDPGLNWFRNLRADVLFRQAEEYWRGITARIAIHTPNPRWNEGLKAILGHVSLCMNEGAPDVAVISYNVFNRDGMYVADMMQKSGRFDLSRRAIEYFLARPFNGRAYPEADNPGQILWAVTQHWLFTRDREWLARVYPSARQIAQMIEYYRTTSGPHYVSQGSLEFGDALPPEKREELQPGRCDGFHPEYTQAFDIAGLRGATLLAEAISNTEDAAHWRSLAARLMEAYDREYGANLRGKEYGNYSVLWPCRLYPLDQGRGHEQFRGIGAQKPGGWRYFPPATAHQGLLAGNREAAHGTLDLHLAHEQMKGWYAFDEFEDGVCGDPGVWRPGVRTNFPTKPTRPCGIRSSAMPHSWAVAEVWHLMRDALLFEDERRLILLAGIDPKWFKDPEGIKVRGAATAFGSFSFEYVLRGSQATLTLEAATPPPDGYVLHLPAEIPATASIDGGPVSRRSNGDLVIPAPAQEIVIDLSAGGR